ncbi:MazG nucleotide pyrophosphohydrolase domain-containing protein [Enterococcus sp. LJL98]
MNHLSIAELQDYLTLKYGKNGNSTTAFMKLVEEVGEVAEALNQLEGIKEKTGEASLAKELADVIHYTLAIASMNQINLSKVILEKDKEAAIKYQQSPNLEEFLLKKRKSFINEAYLFCQTFDS